MDRSDRLDSIVFGLQGIERDLEVRQLMWWENDIESFNHLMDIKECLRQLTLVKEEMFHVEHST